MNSQPSNPSVDRKPKFRGRRWGPWLALAAVLLCVASCQRPVPSTAPTTAEEEGPAEGKSRGAKRLADSESTPRDGFYRRQWAIIVGIKDYEKRRNGYGPLEFSVADAREVRDTLRDEFGFAVEDIRYLEDASATRQAIEAALASWPPGGRVRPDDCLVFYFAGHGVPVEGDSFLLASDSRADDLPHTGLSMRHIRDTLAACVCRHKLVVLDACYSGALFRKFPEQADAASTSTAKADNAFYLGQPAFVGLTAGRDTAVDDGNSAAGHSPFTAALLGSLKVRADTPRADHVFNFRLLAAQVEAAVSRAGRQTPEWGYLAPGGGDFLFRPTLERLTPREMSARAKYAEQLVAARQRLATNRAEAGRILDATPEELRGWEWHHLRLRSERGRMDGVEPSRAPLRSLAFSADGRWLAYGSGQGAVAGGLQLFELATRRTRDVPLGGIEVGAVAFDPRAERLAAAVDNQLALVRVADGVTLWRTKVHAAGALAVAMIADGRQILSGGADGLVLVWNADDGRPVGEPRQCEGPVACVAASSDFRWLAAAGGKTVTLWNTDSGASRSLARPADIRDLSFRGSPPQLVTVDAQGGVVFCDVASGADVLTRNYRHDVQRVAWSANTDLLALALAAPPGIELWNTTTDQRVAQLPGSDGPIALAADGTFLAVCESPKNLRVDRLDGDASRRVYTGHQARVNQVALGVGGLAASVDEAGMLQAWDAWSLAPRFERHSHESAPGGDESTAGDAIAAGDAVAARSVAIDSVGSTIATGGTDGRVKLWIVQTGECVKSIDYADEHDQISVQSLAFDPRGVALAAGANDKSANVWRLPGFERVRRLAGPGEPGTFHTHSVNSLVFFDGGRSIFSAAAGIAEPTSVEWLAWQVEDRRIRFARDAESAKGRLGSVAVSGDGKRLAAAGPNDRFAVWDGPSGRLLFEGRHGGGKGARTMATGVALHPAGNRLVVAGSDRTLSLWDVASESQLLTFDGFEKQIRSLAFSPNGHLLAVAAGNQIHVLSDAAERPAESSAK